MSGYRLDDDDWSKEVVTDEERLETKRLLHALAAVLIIWIFAAGVTAALVGGWSTGVVVGTAILFALPSYAVWKIIESLRTGAASLKLGSYSRSKNPVFFWLSIALFGATALMPWGFFGLIMWDNR